MYSVHMKSLSATEARRNWFRLLDEIVAGEVVVIERGGSLVEPRRREARRAPKVVADYSDIVRVADLDEADRWRWEWQAPGQALEPRSDGE